MEREVGGSCFYKILENKLSACVREGRKFSLSHGRILSVAYIILSLSLFTIQCLYHIGSSLNTLVPHNVYWWLHVGL